LLDRLRVFNLGSIDFSSVDFASLVNGLIGAISIVRIIDILIAALVICWVMMLIRRTRAVQLLKGFVVLLFAFVLSSLLGLEIVNAMLRWALTGLVVAIPVVFQPELRRALEQLGRGKIFEQPIFTLGEIDRTRMIDEVVKASGVLSEKRFGALIVIEKETGLSDFIETGIKLESTVSAELLVNIFVPHTPLHDGAVIIRGDRIAAASCILPLTERLYLSKELGMRHRAGLGITEQSDALVVIISEETGVISVAEDGLLTRYLDGPGLKDMLSSALRSSHNTSLAFLWRKNQGKNSKPKD